MVLADLNRGHVLVVGDVMLDRYVQGHANRLSPEAPVPVLRWAEDRNVPGGAANVAANIAALGGAVSLLGVVGADEGNAELCQALAGFGERLVTRFVVDGARPTTLKTRFVCGGQQLLRLDREQSGPIADEIGRELSDSVAGEVGSAEVVILSDYQKGVLTDAVIRRSIEAAQAAGRLVIVDPKRQDFSIYRGASVITPNRQELTRATGLPCETDDEAERAANVVIGMTQAAVLLTRSEKGISLFAPGEAPLHLPTNAREVYDVSGAGDTVVAALSLALAAGLSLRQAIRIANASAGVVVRKHGTATLTVDELDRALSDLDRVLRSSDVDQDRLGGITPLEDAVRIRRRWRDQGLVTGFTNGCFDILHPGHIGLLEEAAANCDRLIVGLNTDASVARLKGPSRPIQDERSRARVIGALSCVDMVLTFDQDTPYEVIAALQPDLLVKGADYREDQVVGADVVKAAGGRVMLVGLAEGHSTTGIVRRSQEKAPGGGDPSGATADKAGRPADQAADLTL